MKRDAFILGVLDRYTSLLNAFGCHKNDCAVFNVDYLNKREGAEVKGLTNLSDKELILDELDRAEYPALFLIKIKSDPDEYISSIYSYLKPKVMRAHYFVFELDQDVTPDLLARVQSYYSNISPNPRIFNSSPRLLESYAPV